MFTHVFYDNFISIILCDQKFTCIIGHKTCLGKNKDYLYMLIYVEVHKQAMDHL